MSLSPEEFQANKRKYSLMEAKPLYYIREVWGLTPQPIKREYSARYNLGLSLTGKDWDEFALTVRPEWFGAYQEGIHITWQQTLVLFGVEKAIRGEIPMRISIVSGHGIGKTALLSWLILWFLWVHPMCQVASTAPSSDQLYDVLWKELKKWIDKMPSGMIPLYKWETSHIRMTEAPETWFARAKTSSKENTEALAGVHADWVMIPVDEASGVEEPIFETMEGALTSGNILVFLISNPTRNEGYFYDTHHDKDKKRWQCYAFNALESPRVTPKSAQEWADKYGEDSVQYAVRVLGRFPNEGQMDDKGFVQLFSEADIRFRPYEHDWRPVGRVIGALDASGEGEDTSEWAAKDRFTAAILHTEKISSDKGMAAKSVTLCDKYRIDPIDFVIDAFGKGMNVAQEIALTTSQEKRPWRVTPANVGDPCEEDRDKEFYINKRAEGYYKAMLWTRAGGEFMELPTPEGCKRLKEELLSIRFKRTRTGRIQIMDKVQMKKLGFKSPNKADAISMLFLRPDGAMRSLWGDPVSIKQNSNTQFDAFSPVGDV